MPASGLESGDPVTAFADRFLVADNQCQQRFQFADKCAGLLADGIGPNLSDALCYQCVVALMLPGSIHGSQDADTYTCSNGYAQRTPKIRSRELMRFTWNLSR